MDASFDLPNGETLQYNATTDELRVYDSNNDWDYNAYFDVYGNR